MQREREGRSDLSDMANPFGSLWGSGSFGSHRGMMPSLFGGRDLFDDPFFTRPFGSMFESGMFGPSAASCETPPTNRAKGIVIEELNSDYEGEKEDDNENEEEKDNCQKHYGSSKEPSVEHPDDDNDNVVDLTERKIKNVNHKNIHNRIKATQPQGRSFSVQSCKVTYGGVDGAYYTSTRTRSAGSNGVVVEESKEADRTTGQATHKFSRGINDKGHSVTRKLNSDGKVHTMQTLHNLDEDELTGFEEAWKGNVKGHMPHWCTHGNAGDGSGEQKEKATWGGWALPSTEQARNARGMGSENEARTNSSAGRTKKVVRINIQ